MARKRKSETPTGRATGSKFRPNFRRQMLYAGVTLASVLGGYFLFNQLAPSSLIQEKTTGSPQPWYQKQSPPPSLVTVPDAPLFPEPDHVQAAPKEVAAVQENRAYEEALPGEIFEHQPQATTTETAALPVIRKPEIEAPQLPPWRRYAVKLSAPAEGPLIALVIDDMGVDQKRSARAIKFRAPLTLSFLTYANGLDRQTSLARANGHELMLHVSMEPSSSAVDPGPNVLLLENDDEELRRRLNWGFARFSGYVGINNHMGSKFTADSRAMAIVLQAVKDRGLLFFDSRTSADTVGAKLARKMGVPSVQRNIFIDNDNNVDDVKARLTEVEKLAKRTGFAVAIGHPRQATIEVLETWLNDVEARGFRLVPLSVIVEKYGVP